MSRLRSIPVLTLLITIAASAVASEPAKLAGYDDFVNDALRKWDVPGLSMAVVRDGKVILAKGYGRRDIEKNLPMTPDTLLAIGSITKSFTTFVMGQLVDEGKLDWDKPVHDYLPGFRMATPELTEELTVRDMVTHRSGVPRHDLSWYNNQDLSRKELVGRLGELPANAELRARYQYNNMMFLTAGYLIEQLTKMTWEDAVRQRIFKPLGMNRGNFSDAESAKDPDHAEPYRWDGDQEKVIGIPFREVGNMGPAGSINSTANEMSRWLLVQLNRGKFEGRQMIEPATLREMHTPQTTMGILPEQREVSAPGYGMGWVVDSYRGHYRVWHTGGIDGFSALVTLYPNDGVGVVALANASGTSIHALMRDHLVDRLFDLSQKDWSGEALGKRALARKAAKEARTKRTAVRKSGTTPSHPLDAYTGRYGNGGYGALTIEKTDKNILQATYNHIVTPLEHWHYDVFNGAKNEKDPVFEDMKYNFRTDNAGNISAVEAAFEPAVPPIVFEKKPDPKLSDPAFLNSFAGEYTMGAQKLLISVRGSGLFLSFGNQQPRALEPDIDGWFRVKGLSDVRVRLLRDSMELSEPEGVFSATRVRPAPR